MSSLLVFNRVYRLEIQSVMLVFSIQLRELLPLQPFHWFTSPPLPKVKALYIKTVCGWEGVGGVELVGELILQGFNTLFLTRFSTYKIPLPPQTKTWGGGGAQTDKHLPHSPFTGQF